MPGTLHYSCHIAAVPTKLAPLHLPCCPAVLPCRAPHPHLGLTVALLGAAAQFLPTSRSLPLAAALLWLIKMTWIGEDPIHITATVLQGALLALVPLSILFGAFLFFNVLTVTQAGCPVLSRQFRRCWCVTCGNWGDEPCVPLHTTRIQAQISCSETCGSTPVPTSKLVCC